MNNQELQKLVENISITTFKKIFKHHAVFNYRLKTTGGRYLLHSHDIEINPKLITMVNKKILVGIIKHELVHYHLHQQGVIHTHGSKEFKQLLNAVNGLRYTPDLAQTKKYHYACLQCGNKYDRQRRVDTNKYRCGKCFGVLKNI